MLDHLPRDPKHVEQMLCKDILVCPKESNELELLFGIKVDPYLTILGHCLDTITNLLVLSTVIVLTLVHVIGLGGLSEAHELGVLDLGGRLMLLMLRLCVS